MNKLVSVLERAIREDNGTVVSINCALTPKTVLRIIDTRQMMYWGLEGKPGMTLLIEIDNHSKVGRKIIADVNAAGIIDGFKMTDEKRKNIYIKDFGVDILLLVSMLQRVFSILKVDSSRENLYSISPKGETFTIVN